LRLVQKNIMKKNSPKLTIFQERKKKLKSPWSPNLQIKIKYSTRWVAFLYYFAFPKTLKNHIIKKPFVVNDVTIYSIQ
jgi:hypothetical protein